MRFAISLIFALAVSGTALAGPLPTHRGQCTDTVIKQIGTRLDGVTDSGDAVSYVDGGYQVSYGRIKGLQGARVGDPVKLCLTEMPGDCPPGDDRGKTYKATDLRTHKSWQAMNAEHMCGGA